MITRIKSFNGNTLNDTNYQSIALNFGSAATATVAFVTLANSDPTYAGVYAGDVRNLAIAVQIVNYGSRDALENQLRVWFKRGTNANLVVTFLDDGNDYQINCVVQSLVPQSGFPGYFTIVLQAGSSTWSRVAMESDTWTANDATLNKTITISAVEQTRLIASIVPSAYTASGWQYQYLYQLINAAGVNYGTRPWCITLDTASLVTGSKLQASCNDLRIVANGKEIKRWIANPNTATSHVWFNLNIGPGYSLKLKTAVASSGTITQLLFAVTPDTLTALKGMPASFILIHGTEWFQCAGVNLKTYAVNVVKRGALGTTMQAHVLNDVFQFVQNIIFVLAGNSTATDPSLIDVNYDSDKPVFDLGQSDNTQWIYTAATQFYDVNYPTRPGSWTPGLKRVGDQSNYYLYTQNADSGNPALGMLMACWQKSDRWQNESGFISWSIKNAGGFTSISLTGSKNRTTAKWPTLAGLQQSPDGKTWKTLWSEATPATVNTWTAITHASQAVTAGSIWLQVILSPSMGALASASAYLEMLTATIVFTSAKLPVGTLLSQVPNYPLSIRITNTTTGDAVELLHPMLSGKTFLLDGENYLASYDTANAHGALALNDDSRDVWIRLQPGANSLLMEPRTPGDSIGTLVIGLSWYPRRP